MGFACMSVGVKVRAALLTAVTRKALHMGRLGGDTAGDVVSAVATDVGKVYDGLQVRCKHCGSTFQLACTTLRLQSLPKCTSLLSSAHAPYAPSCMRSNKAGIANRTCSCVS